MTIKYRMWYIPENRYLNAADGAVVLPDGKVILQIHSLCKDITDDVDVEIHADFTDKNDNPVYVGDILRLVDTDCTTTVCWSDGACLADDGYPFENGGLNWEIVGNIHDDAPKGDKLCWVIGGGK